MFRSRPIVGFAVRVLLVYGGAMGLWPVVCDGYRELFRTGSESFFGALGQIRFQELSQTVGMDDTRIYVSNRKSGQSTWISVSSRHVG